MMYHAARTVFEIKGQVWVLHIINTLAIIFRYPLPCSRLPESISASISVDYVTRR